MMNPEAKAILDKAKSEGRKFVNEIEAKGVLRAYGVPVTNDVLCDSHENAMTAAKSIGYPVVMKLVSPDVVHKTELKAVRTNIRDHLEISKTFDDIMSRATMAKVRVNGILVSETAVGQEIIIGSLRDPQFGPMVMLGMGGILVEVYKDVSYRLAPVNARDVKEMLAELKGKKLLEGFRGLQKHDIEALTRAVIAVSQIIADFPEIEEMDLNPIFVNENGVKVADARIMIR
jgi:acyl-CoA synthetase (NDP forming)